ncbi:MAG: AMP-binding protein [Pseudomonadota bacterium]
MTGTVSDPLTNSIGQILPTAAARYGDKIALITETRSLSFNELEALSNRAANGLSAMGIQPGERVTLYGPNCWEWLVAYYGAAKIGAVINPINVMLTPDEVRYIVEDAGSRATIAASDKGGPLLDMKDGALSDVILWGEDLPEGATSFNAFLEKGSDSFDPVPVVGTELGKICYTSGTTGRPKGAMQSHRSLIMNAASFALLTARTQQDVVISPLPCPHVYASVVFNASIMFGSKLVMMSRFDAEGMLRLMKEHKGTIIDVVPTGYYYMLALPNFESFDFSSLRIATVGGQTLPAAKSHEFTRRSGVNVYELWGMTEVSGAGTCNPVYGINKPGTIGVAFPGNQARISDLDNPDQEAPVGERGELMFKGPLVMMGYYNNPEATADSIRPDGWMHSGDIATMDEDGYFTIVDRKKDMILTAGYNVYPAELERVLCMHPSVALAAVCGVEDAEKGEIAKAYVMLKPDLSASGPELASHCREHLAAYKVPRALQFVDNVPITSSGKIMRRLLEDQDDGTRSVE